MNMAMKLGLGLEARSINAEEGDGEKSSHYFTAEQVFLALQGKEAGPAVWPQVPRREAHRRCGMVGHCFCKVVISTPRTPAHQLLLALKLTPQLGGLGVTTSASVTFSAHL